MNALGHISIRRQQFNKQLLGLEDDCTDVDIKHFGDEKDNRNDRTPTVVLALQYH